MNSEVAGPDLQVCYRRLDGCRGWADGVHWQAELYDHGLGGGIDGWLSHPVAVAWFTDWSDYGLGVMLDYILVLDEHRRKGYGKALVRAIDERFGGKLFLSDPISEAGAALSESICPEGRGEGDGDG